MRRAGWVVFGLIVAVPVVAVLAAGTVLNSAAGLFRLRTATETATGHPVKLNGGVRLSWSMTPTIEMRDVVVLNAPGYSRSALAAVGRIQARVSLLPLLVGRLEIRSVLLERPDVLLEKNSAGRGNWSWMSPAERLVTLVGDSAPPVVQVNALVLKKGESELSDFRFNVEVQRISVMDGTVQIQGGPPIAIRRLDVFPLGGPASGEILVNGVPLVIGGSVEGDRVDVKGVAPGLTVAVSGRREALAVRMAAADASALSAMAGRALPPLRDVALGFDWPGPTALRLTTGPSPLDGVMPGLVLDRLVVEAADGAQPLRIAAVARLGALPAAVAASGPSVQALLGGQDALFALKAEVDGGTVTAQGSVGGGATVSARLPDLRRAGLLAGRVAERAWPALTDLAVDARVLPRPGGGGVLVRGLRASAAQGDVAGDLALGLGARPSVAGSLVSQRLDLDAIMAVPAGPVAAPVAVPAAATGPVVASAPTAAPHLPFAALRTVDADLRLSADQVNWHGTAYRAVQARLLLQEGRLRLDPAQMVAPGGPVVGQVSADAGAVPPTAAFGLRAAALDVAPLVAALGRPGAATGTVELDVQASGAGSDWAAMAATLGGHLAVSMADGEIDNAALSGLFGPALRVVNLPTEAAGRSRVRCLGVRADAAAGQVTLRTLALDSTRLRMEGEGTMNLVNDTMDLHLRPSIRIGPTSVAVPVQLTGPFKAPVPTVERGVVAPGRFGLSIGGAAADPCPAALGVVRAR